MITSAFQYSAAALAAYRSRHNADTDTLLFNLAAFAWNDAEGIFEIEVRGFTVACVKTLPEVKRFCLMHNSRANGSE